MKKHNRYYFLSHFNHILSSKEAKNIKIWDYESVKSYRDYQKYQMIEMKYTNFFKRYFNNKINNIKIIYSPIFSYNLVNNYSNKELKKLYRKIAIRIDYLKNIVSEITLNSNQMQKLLILGLRNNLSRSILIVNNKDLITFGFDMNVFIQPSNLQKFSYIVKTSKLYILNSYTDDLLFSNENSINDNIYIKSNLNKKIII